jgi:hypothetical protein
VLVLVNADDCRSVRKHAYNRYLAKQLRTCGVLFACRALYDQRVGSRHAGDWRRVCCKGCCCESIVSDACFLHLGDVAHGLCQVSHSRQDKKTKTFSRAQLPRCSGTSEVALPVVAPGVALKCLPRLICHLLAAPSLTFSCFAACVGRCICRCCFLLRSG